VETYLYMCSASRVNLNVTFSQLIRLLRRDISMYCVVYRCPKSLEPMGILFIIYYLHYMLCMFTPTIYAFSQPFTMFMRILLNLLGSTVAQQSGIFCLRGRRSRILTAHTCAFRNPQSAESPPFHAMLMPFLAF
jgi:hypothetical protein